MPSVDAVLLYFIAVVGIFALVVARRRMQQVQKYDPKWDSERLRTWNRTDKKMCIYCETKGTKNRDRNGDPCCMECESLLYP